MIVGGESGHGARPMRGEWVTSVRDQCRATGIPFFFKQWGGVRKKAAGRTLDGQTYDEFPPITPASIADRAARLDAISSIKTSFAPR